MDLLHILLTAAALIAPVAFAWILVAWRVKPRPGGSARYRGRDESRMER